ncbi:sugar ABC transporter substrate-binding protein [Curtobacterium sp. Leaf183]|uniref:ABC transporter substrate-binding protein n=1 Tax=Curtobacterium sp. Leaf183 TaxID=1736291 RepID=UPI000700D319|nr:extracellular solute-binding protein [Curtobacterium sp. Leaf183]KQS08113.1 sugar ABC transporter substrate-binding protein [Curtobacterium sp. Leaf183]
MRTSSKRRRTAAVLATAVAAAIVLTGCSAGSSASSGKLTTWLWPGAVGDTVVSSAKKEFSSDKLQVNVIGGDFKQKLVTTFTGKSNIPSITGVKGEDMPYFLQQSSLFTDLKDVVPASYLAQFPKWKLAEATTADGKLIGLPTDIGPSALFYRQDVLEKAGLPSEPAAVADATSTWDKYFAFGKQLKEKTGASLEVSMGDVFSWSMAQADSGFVNKSGKFTGDSDTVKQAWDRAVTAEKDGIVAGIEDGSPDWASAVNEGTIPTVLGAAWHAGDIKSAAPDTSGSWRVTATPGGPGNVGGSFLTIPAATSDKKTALKVIESLISPSAQATTYSQVGNFPSSSKALDESALTKGDSFFGGQDTASVFKDAIESMPTKYTSPYDAQVSAPYLTQLTNIQSQGKDADQAWDDAVKAAKSALESAK